MLRSCEDHNGAVVVYDVNRNQPDCPLCELETQIKDLEKDLDAAKDKIQELEEELAQ